MAILSEVVEQRVGSGRADVAPALHDIGHTARGLVDSMSDLVWSIDPRRDEGENLIVRIRQFASDMFEPRGIDHAVEADEETARVRLSPECRRHLLLIFKEAIVNTARHARCRTARLRFRFDRETLCAEIEDDGCGFGEADGDRSRGGHGLASMRARAAQLGGRLEIDSRTGEGTRIFLTVPCR